MTDAVLHIAHQHAKPGGIWWVDGEMLKSYYTDGELKKVGESFMLRRKPDADLAQLFEYLDNRLPYTDIYVRVSLDNIDPKEFLKLEQRS